MRDPTKGTFFLVLFHSNQLYFNTFYIPPGQVTLISQCHLFLFINVILKYTLEV